MKLRQATVSVAFMAGLTAGPISRAVDTVDPNLMKYTKASGVSGNLSSVGSDTLNNLMTLWAEECKRIYPRLSRQVLA